MNHSYSLEDLVQRDPQFLVQTIREQRGRIAQLEAELLKLYGLERAVRRSYDHGQYMGLDIDLALAALTEDGAS